MRSPGQFLVLSCLLSMVLASPALACGSCAMDACLLHISFLPAWFKLSCLWFVAAVGIRIYTRTLSSARVLATLGWMAFAFVAAAMLGPIPLAVFLLAWFLKYLSHIRDTSGSDPASKAFAKLGHLFLVGLLLTAAVGIRHDKTHGPEAKLSRGIGGSNTRRFCLQLARDGTIPSETLLQLAQSQEAPLRWNALAVLAYSENKESIPLLIKVLNEPEDNRPYWLNGLLRDSLEKQTGLSISEPEKWNEWLKDPEAFVPPDE